MNLQSMAKFETVIIKPNQLRKSVKNFEIENF